MNGKKSQIQGFYLLKLYTNELHLRQHYLPLIHVAPTMLAYVNLYKILNELS